MASGAATMKMINSTSITSINGVTLISWVSAKSPSSSNSLPATETAIALLRRCAPTADMGAVEIARQQPRRHARGAIDELKIALRHPREVIVDDHRRNRRDQADRGCEQRLGDAGRDDRQIGGLCLGDADEGVHDAPDRAEQADERRGRADGGEQAHAEPDAAGFRADDFGRTRGGALLDAGV